jgi:small subunit ribosomal protein S1
LSISETPTPELNAVTESLSDETQGSNWYEEWIADYDITTPERGQFLEGKILRIDDDALVVDVGMKRDAVVPARDLNQLSSELIGNLKVGDQVAVYVLHMPVGDEDLLVSLSKGFEFSDWNDAEKAMEEQGVLTLDVIGFNKGGLLVKFRSLDGFIPYSHVPELRNTRDQRRADDIKRGMVGKKLHVKPVEVDQPRRRLVFSAEAAQEDLRKKRMEEIQPGDIMRGPVVSIVKFGAFVDLDGVDGLIHISKLDWQHVEHPSHVLKVGDVVDVKVIDIDIERERISLDRKALLPNPWQVFDEQNQPGDTVEGTITNVVEFGAFVELANGVEGLVHVSELGYTESANPQDTIRPGETVLVRILNVEPDRGRVSLSMRQVPLERQLDWSLVEEPNEQVDESVNAE